MSTQNSTARRRNKRQTVLNVYRVIVALSVMANLVMSGILLHLNTSTAPDAADVAQPTETELQASFVENAGFANPIYVGISEGTEGTYPTFRATAIGGELIDLWIRTTRNGGWEIQPSVLFETVTSADDFAGIAFEAVCTWENLPEGIQPSTDEGWGEYESAEYMYGLLLPYSTSESC